MKARILAVSFPLLSNNKLEQQLSALHVMLNDPKSSLGPRALQQRREYYEDS